MDEHGLEVDELERMLAGLRPKLLYTIFDHQNPAGVSLAGERREPLVDLARRYGFVILEDVAYRDLGFEGDTLPSLWSLAPDVVALAGTTSKTFFPWAAAPADVTAQLVAVKQTTDQFSSALGLRLLEELHATGLDRRTASEVADALPPQGGISAGGVRACNAERRPLDDRPRRLLGRF